MADGETAREFSHTQLRQGTLGRESKDFNREIHEIPAVAPAVAALWRGKQKLWRGEHEPRKLSGGNAF